MITTNEETEALIWRALGTVLDPEFGVGIVDLGLIYAVRLEDGVASIAMTLTSQTCPAGVVLMEGARAAVEGLPGVREVCVALVWEPAWTPERLTAEAREQLGWNE